VDNPREVAFTLDEGDVPWGKKVAFTRAGFGRRGVNGQIVQYYTFSLNGYNEPSWKKVRWHLATSPWEKYCYFAKIQFAPIAPVTDLAATDRAAEQFVREFLPHVLKALPSSSQVELLNAGGPAKRD
jgi:hypothetical protein